MQVEFGGCGGFFLFFIRFLEVLVFHQKKVLIVELQIAGQIMRKTL